MSAPLRLSLLCLTLAATPLAAQQPDTSWKRQTPMVVKYGKWATLALAVGMGLKASAAHHDADRAFNLLSSYCLTDPTRCNQGPGGRYIDPVAEGYYQASVRSDRHARGWLLGGEGALLATAGLFVWELTRPKQPPKNIPFEPTVTVVGAVTQFGVRVAF
ncbi:MAG: hypothetical protein ABI742_09060 [Gemmatimonadota bacterium]